MQILNTPVRRLHALLHSKGEVILKLSIELAFHRLQPGCNHPTLNIRSRVILVREHHIGYATLALGVPKSTTPRVAPICLQFHFWKILCFQHGSELSQLSSLLYGLLQVRLNWLGCLSHGYLLQRILLHEYGLKVFLGDWQRRNHGVMVKLLGRAQRLLQVCICLGWSIAHAHLRY